MESNKPPSRELTYRDGWKTGRIAANVKAGQPSMERPDPAEHLGERLPQLPAVRAGLLRESRFIGGLSDRLLPLFLLCLPLLVFLLFVWLVSQLSRLAL